MKEWVSKEGTKIYLIASKRCNAYLIQKNMQCILIDTSTRNNLKFLIRSLNKLSITNINYLVLTHLHYDHCQTANEIANKYGCKTIFSHNESVHAAKGYTSVPKGTNFITKIISGIGNMLILKKHFFMPIKGDILINNKDYQIEPNIKIIQTPGHSRGSLSIIIDQEIAIVGDTLFGIFPDKCFPPFADYVPELLNSWTKLLHTPCTFFLPGHGKAIQRNVFEKEYNKRITT